MLSRVLNLIYGETLSWVVFQSSLIKANLLVRVCNPSLVDIHVVYRCAIIVSFAMPWDWSSFSRAHLHISAKRQILIMNAPFMRHMLVFPYNFWGGCIVLISSLSSPLTFCRTHSSSIKFCCKSCHLAPSAHYFPRGRIKVWPSPNRAFPEFPIRWSNSHESYQACPALIFRHNPYMIDKGYLHCTDSSLCLIICRNLIWTLLIFFSRRSIATSLRSSRLFVSRRVPNMTLFQPRLSLW